MRNRFLKVILYILVLLWSLPIFLAIVASLSNPDVINSNPGRLYLGHFSISSYVDFIRVGPFNWLINSFYVSVTSAIVTVLFSVPLGLFSGVYDESISNISIRLLLLTYLIPPVLLLFPILDLAISYNLRGSHVFVGLLSAAFAVPVSSWILEARFNLVPKQLIEISFRDDLSIFQRFRHIYIPYCGRSIVAVFAFAFIIGWGEYTFSTGLLPLTRDYTISVALPHFLEGDVWNWSHLLASVPFSTVPPILCAYLVISVLPVDT